MTTASQGRLLHRFVGCRTLRDQYDFLRSHPEILTGESVAALQQMRDAATRGGHADAAALIGRYRDQLERCAALGVEAAFCAEGLSWLCLADPALVPIADMVLRRMQAFRDTGQATDLNQAIEAAAAIMRHPGFQQAPGPIRAATYFDEGFLFWMRYGAFHDSSDLEPALARWKQALDTLGAPRAPGTAATDYAKYLRYYLSVYADQVRLAGNTAPVDAVILRAEEASRQSALADAAGAHHMWLEFARVWRQRARRTGDLAEIEKAVSAAQTALRVWPADDDPGQAAVRHTLGNALQDRYLATGGLAHLDEALESFSAAVARMPETADADSRASQFDSLANALRDRWARTGNKADLDSAIETRRKLLEIATGRDPGHSLLLANLGTNLRERFLLTAHAPDIDESIARYETALQEAGQDPGARSTCTTGLAAALRTRFDFRHQRADIERAITLCESLLDELGPGVPDRDSCKANLANALWDRSRTFGTADDARRATELYLEVLSSSPLRPELAVLTARNLITAGAQLQAWADVATGALAGLAAMDRLVQTQYTREHKEAWLRDARDLSSSAAFALARTGRLEEALVALETGRARLLSETFETGRTGHAPSAEEIIQAAAGAPIVYITDTNEGGLALIVSGPQRPLRVVWLPALTRDEVADRTIRYLQLFLSDSLGAEPVVLDNLGQWLWEAMMGPILAELPAPPEMVLPAPREIVLIPAGSLATLPLHAAWRPGDGPAGGRIHVIDECAVTYAANARARQTASNRAALLSTASLLVVEDPRPTSAGRLEHTGPEADAALAARPGLRLRHEQATKARVRPELRNHSVLHLACHGSVNLYAPLQSRLILAHDEPLTLGELMDDRLPQVRLAVLSACETAVAGRELMDEVVNFPAGMLQAGAAACIGSLWKVSDASTALLMRRFYELWRGTTGPSAALQRAQQWLRDISNEELIASGYAPAPPADDRSQLEQDFWLKARPYYHPFYWAAFAFYGA